MRDQGLLASALTRPRNQFIYDPADIAKLAAANGFGAAQNHAFVDGNKRSAFIATVLFLRLNGWRLATERLDSLPPGTVKNVSWNQFAGRNSSRGLQRQRALVQIAAIAKNNYG